MTKSSSRPKATVLISDGRSGTNFLVSKLLQTGKVAFGREPFNTDPGRAKDYGGQGTENIPADVLEKMNDPAFRNSDPDAYISYCAGLTGALDETGVAVSGFKIFPSHNLETYWKMTRDTRFAPIILQRKSVLSVYSSLLIALKTNKWVQSSKEAPKPAEQTKVLFKAKEFEEFRQMYVGRMLRAEENMRSAGVSYCKTFYEDLISDEKELRRVFAFLGLKPDMSKESPVAVQNTPNILDRFQNPRDVMPYYKQEIAADIGTQPAEGKLTIHIGPPKSGTTSLQLGLQKVETPNFTYLGTKQSRTSNITNGVYRRVMKGCREDMPDDYYARLLFTLDSRLKSGTDLLLSEEMLLVDEPAAPFQHKLKRLGELCQRFNPQIIITPREPVSGLKSLYSELYFRQKPRKMLTFSQFLVTNQAKIYDYEIVLDVLQNSGLTNIKLLRIDRKAKSISLSDITGRARHTEKVSLPIANETEKDTKQKADSQEMPEKMQARLTKSYENVLQILG